MDITIQASHLGHRLDLLRYFRFTFNCNMAIQPTVQYADYYRHINRYPPCYDSTALRLVSNTAFFSLEFAIHPDSVRTVTVSVDPEFNRQTGLKFSSLTVETGRQLYYIPFTFIAS